MTAIAESRESTPRSYIVHALRASGRPLLMLLFGIVMLLLLGSMTTDDGRNPLLSGRSRDMADLPPLPQAGLPGAVPAEKELLEVALDTAREINARQPFSTLANVPARPFASRLAGPEYERALACLSVAAVYEAGGAADDQYPVMQVILNRVRHSAFPNSVCGVVFQGSERRTGCQFSFTCDGSMARWQPSPATMKHARERAAEMLAGRVDARVGLATHYHTDWVVPYWSSSLEKIVAVKTHLFFRWPGYWGTRASFHDLPATFEPSIAQLASVDPVHGIAGAEPDVVDQALTGSLDGALAEAAVAVPGAAAPVAAATPSVTVLTLALDADAKPGRWALDALSLCGKRAECRVVGWTDPARKPASLDTAGLAASPPDFVLVQELRNRVQQPYWDCGQWAKASTSRCLSGGAEAARLVYGG